MITGGAPNNALKLKEYEKKVLRKAINPFATNFVNVGKINSDRRDYFPSYLLFYLGLLFKNRMICDTFYLSKIFYYYTNSFSLMSLCQFNDIPVNESHRAEEDAKNSGLLFVKILENKIQYSNAKTIQKLINCIELFDVPNKKLFNSVLGCSLNTNIDMEFKETEQYSHPKFHLEYNSQSSLNE